MSESNRVHHESLQLDFAGGARLVVVYDANGYDKQKLGPGEERLAFAIRALGQETTLELSVEQADDLYRMLCKVWQNGEHTRRFQRERFTYGAIGQHLPATGERQG